MPRFLLPKRALRLPGFDVSETTAEFRNLDSDVDSKTRRQNPVVGKWLKSACTEASKHGSVRVDAYGLTTGVVFPAQARETAVTVADIFFPRHCVGCGQSVDRPNGHICWECFRSIELREKGLCDCCGLKIESAVTHAFTCSVCHDTPPAFDRARSAGRFSGALRESLHQFKYGQATWLCGDLADLLHGCVLAHYAVAEVDVVAPVPLHASRRRDRGYNQAALLGAELAQRLQRPFVGDALMRTRATPTQTRLHARERRRNVHGAFVVRAPEWVRGRTVLLVDDVMTTGATLSEAARTLKRAGACRVWAVTAARG
jgi:ComF family protein